MAALVLAVASTTSCGGPDGSDDPTPAPDGPSSSTATADESTAPADPAAYLPTPDGVELTSPGTVLDFKEGAFAAWTPRQDVVGVVGVSVLRVERTTVEESLAGFELDPADAASTPYFVTVKVGNGGETDLGGRQLPVYAVDEVDRLIPPTGVDPGFEGCPGSVLPAVFAPGDMTRSCLIFLVPPDSELASVMFRPPEGVVPITWTGEVTSPGRQGEGGQREGRRGARAPRG